jgi:hypothetical protein
MKAITYTNTKTTVPNWVNTLHERQAKGYAIETPTHYVHYYGQDKPYYTISVGLTAMEKKDGTTTLEEWVIKTFGAINIQPMKLEAGVVIDGVWRPGLHNLTQIVQALAISESEKRNYEQVISLLIERLEDLFLYIYPDSAGLSTYGHKSRELLILACTEVENSWKYYMNKVYGIASAKRYTTNDYVKLNEKLYLKDFQFIIGAYPAIPTVRPFGGWNNTAPTISLNWYDAYNKTKHDRDANFSEATLWQCIQAVVANLVLYSVRFSPQELPNQRNKFSALYNAHFRFELINTDPTTFYITKLDLPTGGREDLFIFDSVKNNFNLPFNINPLTL